MVGVHGGHMNQGADCFFPFLFRDFSVKIWTQQHLCSYHHQTTSGLRISH
jgi:hypothetical protein